MLMWIFNGKDNGLLLVIHAVDRGHAIKAGQAGQAGQAVQAGQSRSELTHHIMKRSSANVRSLDAQMLISRSLKFLEHPEPLPI